MVLCEFKAVFRRVSSAFLVEFVDAMDKREPDLDEESDEVAEKKEDIDTELEFNDKFEDKRSVRVVLLNNLGVNKRELVRLL
jgi:hypothetical protein